MEEAAQEELSTLEVLEELEELFISTTPQPQVQMQQFVTSPSVFSLILLLINHLCLSG